MSIVRLRAVVHRHWIVLRRSPHRWFEISFWPMMDVLLWGSLGVFVAKQDPTSKAGTPYLLAGIMLFWTFTQAQFSIALGVNEETWTRNILNVLTTPVSELEYIVGIAIFGLLKLALCMLTITVVTMALFGFDLSEVGWSVIPIVLLLMVNGWALAMLVVGLVLRFGQSAEVFAWGILFVIMPLSGVFYPIDALPTVLQPIARVLPTTHAFIAARDLLGGQPMPWDQIWIALVGCLVAAAAGIWFVTHMLGVFRKRGFVTRFS